jgi:hypothetical protein
VGQGLVNGGGEVQGSHFVCGRNIGEGNRAARGCVGVPSQRVLGCFKAAWPISQPSSVEAERTS